MRFIELDMVLRNSLQPNRRSRTSDDDHIYRDTDEPGEGVQAPAEAPADPNVEATTPVYLNPDTISRFYRRQPDRAGEEAKVGTRIVFADGGYIKVTNPVSEVLAKITGDQQG